MNIRKKSEIKQDLHNWGSFEGVSICETLIFGDYCWLKKMLSWISWGTCFLFVILLSRDGFSKPANLAQIYTHSHSHIYTRVHTQNDTKKGTLACAHDTSIQIYTYASMHTHEQRHTSAPTHMRLYMFKSHELLLNWLVTQDCWFKISCLLKESSPKVSIDFD